MVWKIRVVRASTQEVEYNDDVEGKRSNRQVPAVKHRGESTIEEDTGNRDGDGDGGGDGDGLLLNWKFF